MTDTGIIRKLDQLGRIVFPKELRDTFGWEVGTKLQIYTEGQKVIVSKYEPTCIFCGEPTEEHIKEHRICPDCAAKYLNALYAIADKAD